MMRTIIIWIFLLTIGGIPLYSQTNLKLGLSFMTETIVYPGFTLEAEREKMQSKKIALPQRISLGFYSHPRNHNGFFAEFQQGFRRYYKSGLFLENAIGIGTMATFYNEDVWEIEKTIEQTSNFAGMDWIFSVNFGIGYSLGEEKRNLIFFRPKIFWQFPFNQTALPHTAFQVGYSHTIKTK